MTPLTTSNLEFSLLNFTGLVHPCHHNEPLHFTSSLPSNGQYLCLDYFFQMPLPSSPLPTSWFSVLILIPLTLALPSLISVSLSVHKYVVGISDSSVPQVKWLNSRHINHPLPSPPPPFSAVFCQTQQYLTTPSLTFRQPSPDLPWSPPSPTRIIDSAAFPAPSPAPNTNLLHTLHIHIFFTISVRSL